MSKQELRRELKDTRLSMNTEDVIARSGLIAEQLIAGINWADIKNTHIYSDVAEWKEVQTRPIIEYVRRQWPKIKVSLVGKSPAQEPPKQQFDLIIVPCLGFDKELYRLGLGAGFYDRLLANQANALKIGLCFAAAFVKSGLPHEPHDIPLDKIVTETGIITRL